MEALITHKNLPKLLQITSRMHAEEDLRVTGEKEAAALANRFSN